MPLACGYPSSASDHGALHRLGRGLGFYLAGLSPPSYGRAVRARWGWSTAARGTRIAAAAYTFWPSNSRVETRFIQMYSAVWSAADAASWVAPARAPSNSQVPVLRLPRQATNRHLQSRATLHLEIHPGSTARCSRLGWFMRGRTASRRDSSRVAAGSGWRLDPRGTSSAASQPTRRASAWAASKSGCSRPTWPASSIWKYFRPSGTNSNYAKKTSSRVSAKSSLKVSDKSRSKASPARRRRSSSCCLAGSTKPLWSNAASW